MSGRFPGAATWRSSGEPARWRGVDLLLLRRGAEAAGVDPAVLSRRDYVKAGGVLDGHATCSTRPSSASARGRPRSWTRSSAVPRVRVGGPRGRGLRPGGGTRLDRRLRGREPEHLPVQPARNPEMMAARWAASRPLHRQRQGLPHDARVVQAEPEGARASPCRRPAPRRWWPCTWPARAC